MANRDEYLRLSLFATCYWLTSSGAALGLALEEQGLADDRRDGGRLKRLGDQEGRLRSFSGEEALGIGGDEDHRHFECLQELVDGIQSGASVCQLDIRENEAG